MDPVSSTKPRTGGRTVRLHTPNGYESGTNGAKTPWFSKRHTPYGKTPDRRKDTYSLYGNGPLQRSEEGDLLIKELTQKTLSVYRLSPLYDFQPTQTKQYSKLLSAFIEAEIKKGVAIGLGSETVGRARLSISDGMCLTEDDPRCVKITIESDRGEKSTTVLTAVLCRLGCTDSSKERNPVFTHYPILLVRGLQRIVTHVINWLQHQFDCCINKMTFTSVELMWMVAMWSGFVPEKVSSKQLELQYKIPDRCDGLDTMTLTILQSDSRRLWLCIHDETSDEFSADEVNCFIRSLEDHFFTVFRIYLNALQLKLIGTPMAMVGVDGKLKVFNKDGFLHVARHICVLATERTQLQ